MIWKCMSVLGVFAASSAWAAPTVTMSGDCPGVITITVDNITPGECIGIAYGDDAGGAGQIVNRGDCTGTVMGLDPMNYAFSACDYDGDGSITFSPDIDARWCGLSFQILDMDSCEPSDVEHIDLSDCEEGGGVDSWVGDGECDDVNANADCDWDGGDCDVTTTGTATERETTTGYFYVAGYLYYGFTEDYDRTSTPPGYESSWGHTSWGSTWDTWVPTFLLMPDRDTWTWEDYIGPPPFYYSSTYAPDRTTYTAGTELYYGYHSLYYGTDTRASTWTPDVVWTFFDYICCDFSRSYYSTSTTDPYYLYYYDLYWGGVDYEYSYYLYYGGDGYYDTIYGTYYDMAYGYTSWSYDYYFDAAPDSTSTDYYGTGTTTGTTMYHGYEDGYYWTAHAMDTYYRGTGTTLYHLYHEYEDGYYWTDYYGTGTTTGTTMYHGYEDGYYWTAHAMDTYYRGTGTTLYHLYYDDEASTWTDDYGTGTTMYDYYTF